MLELNRLLYVNFGSKIFHIIKEIYIYFLLLEKTFLVFIIERLWLCLILGEYYKTHVVASYNVSTIQNGGQHTTRKNIAPHGSTWIR